MQDIDGLGYTAEQLPYYKKFKSLPGYFEYYRVVDFLAYDSTFFSRFLKLFIGSLEWDVFRLFVLVERSHW